MKQNTIVKTSQKKVGEIVLEHKYLIYPTQITSQELQVSKEEFEKAQKIGIKFKEEQPYVLLGTKEIQIHENQLEVLPYVRIKVKKESILLPQEDAQIVLAVFKRNQIPYSLS